MVETGASFSWVAIWTFFVLDLAVGIAVGFVFGRLQARWAAQAQAQAAAPVAAAVAPVAPAAHRPAAFVAVQPAVQSAADRAQYENRSENVSSPEHQHQHQHELEHQQELEHALEVANERPLNEAEKSEVLHHFAEVSEEAPLNLERFGTVAEPPNSLLRFVRNMGLTEEFCATNRRSTPRYGFTATVVVVPIDERSRPIGPPFKAVTRDLATNSISFLHTRSFDTRFFAIQIELPVYGQTTLIARQVRCTACGRFYHVAGTLLAKFHSNMQLEVEPQGIETLVG